MLHLYLAILCLFFSQTGVFARSQGFNQLKMAILHRNLEPKLYLPNQVFIGTDLTIMVNAPGAKTVKLLASKEAGRSSYGENEIMLPEEHFEIGTKELSPEQSKAKFQLQLKEKEYLDHVDKFLFFEALIDYEDGNGQIVTKTASFFGSNASYSNVNAVRLQKPPEDNSQASAMARQMMPGFGGGMNNPNMYR